MCCSCSRQRAALPALPAFLRCRRASGRLPPGGRNVGTPPWSRCATPDHASPLLPQLHPYRDLDLAENELGTYCSNLTPDEQPEKCWQVRGAATGGLAAFALAYQMLKTPMGFERASPKPKSSSRGILPLHAPPPPPRLPGVLVPGAQARGGQRQLRRGPARDVRGAGAIERDDAPAAGHGIGGWSPVAPAPACKQLARPQLLLQRWRGGTNAGAVRRSAGPPRLLPSCSPSARLLHFYPPLFILPAQMDDLVATFSTLARVEELRSAKSAAGAAAAAEPSPGEQADPVRALFARLDADGDGR